MDCYVFVGKVIYHLKHNSVNEAYELVKDLDPVTPQDYIIKGVVLATLGQSSTGKREHIKTAEQYFQMVGSAASECDTIPGRQCMAMCFYLLKQFEDVLIYLNSVKAYMVNDDDFNFNHGIALAATHDYKAAEEALLLIKSDAIKAEPAYIKWLARSNIMNGNPLSAWDLYLKMEAGYESFQLLEIIANDCYKVGFLHSFTIKYPFSFFNVHLHLHFNFSFVHRFMCYPVDGAFLLRDQGI